jgi:hypothetical protein
MPLLIITSFGALIWMNLSTTIKGATPVLQAAPEIDLRIFKSWSNLRAAHALLFLYYELRRIQRITHYHASNGRRNHEPSFGYR